MRRDTEKKTLLLARHVIATKDTVRSTARVFGISKSQVHYLLHHFLKEIHPGLFQEVKKVMDYHQSVKHLRGGEATKEKYRLLRQHKNS